VSTPSTSPKPTRQSPKSAADFQSGELPDALMNIRLLASRGLKRGHSFCTDLALRRLMSWAVLNGGFEVSENPVFRQLRANQLG
jgi:hypothetical protein